MVVVGILVFLISVKWHVCITLPAHMHCLVVQCFNLNTPHPDLI